MAESDGVLAPLYGKSQTLFLVAGGLLVPFAALLAYEAVTNTAAPEDVFGPPGFFFAMLGLLGLYPSFVRRTPRLARAGVVAAAVAAVGWSAVTATSVGEAVGALPPLEAFGALGLVVVLAAGVPMLLAYLSFGVASLRTDAYSRTLGFLLLAPPAIFAVMLVGGAATGGSALGAAILSSGQAISHLAIGYTLWTGGTSTAGAGSPADATP